jgi:hypothetical protein
VEARPTAPLAILDGAAVPRGPLPVLTAAPNATALALAGWKLHCRDLTLAVDENCKANGCRDREEGEGCREKYGI